MAEVHPFRGLRYDVAQVGDLSDVTCPPYDVIDTAFQERLYEQHPCNVIRLELNRDEPGDPDPDEKYRRASDFVRKWIKQGVLIQEHEDSLYAYHQVFDWEGRTYTRRGFLGRIRLERFGEGKVFPHEQTLSGPKADRLKLLEACKMNLSPIFGLYPDDDNAVQSPLERAITTLTPHEATDHLGVVHRLWPVSNHETIEKAGSPTLIRDKPVFIADGHHRYETAINYRDGLISQGKLAGPDSPPNCVMMMFVGMSDPGLVILPTHRLVSGLTAARLRSDLESALRETLRPRTGGQGSRCGSRNLGTESRPTADKTCWAWVRQGTAGGLSRALATAARCRRWPPIRATTGADWESACCISWCLNTCCRPFTRADPNAGTCIRSPK